MVCNPADLVTDAQDHYFISIPEFGRRFDLSRSRSYELVYAGEIATVRCGGRRLVPIAECHRFARGLLEQLGTTCAPVTKNRTARNPRVQELASENGK